MGAADVADKIALLTTANLAGLTSKEEFILKKLKYYKKEQIELICAIDDACRAKLEARLEEYKGVIDTARDAAFAGAKECRVNYVDQLLYQKEIIKGELEDLLNETIQEIKNLKVEGILNESGMPTEEHKSVIDAQIVTLTTAFETNSDLLIENTMTNLGFKTYLTDAAAAFSRDTMITADAAVLSCLDEVYINFTNVYDDPESMVAPVQAENMGLKYDLEALYDDCKAELDEFKIDAEAQMQTQITAYTNDANKQEHKAKADFLRLIETSIIKLHGFNNLTSAEKILLKTAIVA